MATFDDREHAFENKFAHDAEMQLRQMHVATNCSIFGRQS